MFPFHKRSKSASDGTKLVKHKSRRMMECEAKIRQRFKVGENERLVAIYPVALEKTGLLLQGRMFIFEHSLAFRGCALGICSVESIRYSDIGKIKKKSGYIVSSNSLVVKTKDRRKFVFVSLHAVRDEAYTVLLNAWKISTGQLTDLAADFHAFGASPDSQHVGAVHVIDGESAPASGRKSPGILNWMNFGSFGFGKDDKSKPEGGVSNFNSSSFNSTDSASRDRTPKTSIDGRLTSPHPSIVVLDDKGVKTPKDRGPDSGAVTPKDASKDGGVFNFNSYGSKGLPGSGGSDKNLKVTDAYSSGPQAPASPRSSSDKNLKVTDKHTSGPQAPASPRSPRGEAADSEDADLDSNDSAVIISVLAGADPHDAEGSEDTGGLSHSGSAPLGIPHSDSGSRSASNSRSSTPLPSSEASSGPTPPAPMEVTALPLTSKAALKAPKKEKGFSLFKFLLFSLRNIPEPDEKEDMPVIPEFDKPIPGGKFSTAAVASSMKACREKMTIYNGEWEVDGLTFVSAILEVARVFDMMGGSFSFIKYDITTKTEKLTEVFTEHRERFTTIQGMCRYEIETKTNGYRSGTWCTVRLRWLLEFLKVFLACLVADDGDRYSSRESASIAYAQALAAHHPWPIRKMVQGALKLIPNKDWFLKKMGVEMSVVVLDVGMFAEAVEPVFQSIQTFHAKHKCK